MIVTVNKVTLEEVPAENEGEPSHWKLSIDDSAKGSLSRKRLLELYDAIGVATKRGRA